MLKETVREAQARKVSIIPSSMGHNKIKIALLRQCSRKVVAIAGTIAILLVLRVTGPTRNSK